MLRTSFGAITLNCRLPCISQVGDDEFGYMLADILKQNNVDTSSVRYDSSARTALAFVTLRADGEREFLFFRHPSADMLLHESELDKKLIKQVFFSHSFFIKKHSSVLILVGFYILENNAFPNYT